MCTCACKASSSHTTFSGFSLLSCTTKFSKNPCELLSLSSVPIIEDLITTMFTLDKRFRGSNDCNVLVHDVTSAFWMCTEEYCCIASSNCKPCACHQFCMRSFTNTTHILQSVQKPLHFRKRTTTKTCAICQACNKCPLLIAQKTIFNGVSPGAPNGSTTTRHGTVEGSRGMPPFLTTRTGL